MATLTPTLTLTSSNVQNDSLDLSITDSLAIAGDVKRYTKVLATTNTTVLNAADYNKSYVYMHNKSSTTAEIVTIEKVVIDATCDYNDDPTVAMDSTKSISFGMAVSGTGIHGSATVASITNTTTIELSHATTGGSVTDGTLTFLPAAGTDSYIILGPGEFAFFPWEAVTSLSAISASGTPTLDIMLFEATA